MICLFFYAEPTSTLINLSLNSPLAQQFLQIFSIIHFFTLMFDCFFLFTFQIKVFTFQYINEQLKKNLNKIQFQIIDFIFNLQNKKRGDICLKSISVCVCVFVCLRWFLAMFSQYRSISVRVSVFFLKKYEMHFLTQDYSIKRLCFLIFLYLFQCRLR